MFGISRHCAGARQATPADISGLLDAPSGRLKWFLGAPWPAESFANPYFKYVLVRQHLQLVAVSTPSLVSVKDLAQTLQ